MIRHGQTEANANQIMAGSLDSPLTKLGRQQALNVHHALDHLSVQPTHVYHSHLSRARDTATLINQKLSLPQHEDAGLAELDTGEWEGVPYDQCRPVMREWVDPPGGEPYRAFLSRIRDAKTRILGQEDIVPLIVSHGGVFRALAKLYDINIHGVRNCVLYEFAPTPEQENFPWTIWRYDHDKEISDSVHRRRITLTSHDPDSEIA